MAASVDTICSPVAISCSPVDSSGSAILARIVLDSTGWWIVQLFHHTNISGFFCCHWRAESATLAAPASTGDWTEQNIQPIGTKNYEH